jgi:multidrug efflux system membrane fusion protein
MNFQELSSATLLPAGPLVAAGRRRRVVATVAGIAIAVLAALVAFQAARDAGARARQAANRPATLAVSYETVAPRSLPQGLTAVGSLAAINRATLSVEAGGTVTRIAFAPGAHVKEGELLVQLNDASERADLASLRAQERYAQSGLGRTRTLTQSGASSRAQLDQTQSQAEVAVAGIARAEAAIAKKALRAPFEGDVGLNLVDPGEYVTPGTPVVQLTDKSRLYLHFTLPEQMRPRLALDQAVSFAVDAYPGVPFQARIAVIDPEVDDSTRAIRLHAIADNTDGRLMPGMYASVRVDLGAAPDVLTVPETAVSYSLAGNALFIAVPGDPGADGNPTLKAKKVAVRTGAAVEGRVPVLSGVKAGDRVVTSGQTKLFDGSPIALKADTPLVPPADLPRP